MSVILPQTYGFEREQAIHNLRLEQFRTALERQRQELTNTFQEVIDHKNRDIARLTRENGDYFNRERDNFRQQRDLRDNIREHARVVHALRYVLDEYKRRFGEIDPASFGTNQDISALERIETLINNNLVNQQPPFRTSLIKYTSPAFWVFSIYDAMARYCSIAYQSIKTHITGLRVLVFG